MQLVGNSWDQILEDEYHKDYFKKIKLYIKKEKYIHQKTIF